MALGGGTFVAQNKELPGAYINFVSAARADAVISDRGVCTMPLELDWGPDDEVFTISAEEFHNGGSLKIFGYPVNHEKMKGMSDLFLNARTLHAYRLNSGGSKAENAFARAKYSGICGNNLKIVVQMNTDDNTLYDVDTYIGESKVDSQTVKDASGLVDNDYVSFKADAELMVSASVPLEGGTNGTADGTAHQKYLNRIESYSYNTMGVPVTDETTKKLYAAFTRRLRDELGVKFQLVLHRMSADYMGIINVKNNTTDSDWPETSLVYWVTGLECGCEVNRSCQNRKYDGSFTVDTEFTQTQLKQCLRDGELVMHKVNSDIRVLEDTNSMVTVSDECGDIFKDNQTIRVIDQLANDIALLFSTKYLGAIPNNNAGRVSLWSDIVAYHRQLEQIRAIEGFSDSDIVVQPGSTKKSVQITDSITVINSMGQLYMSVVVS